MHVGRLSPEDEQRNKSVRDVKTHVDHRRDLEPQQFGHDADRQHGDRYNVFDTWRAALTVKQSRQPYPYPKDIDACDPHSTYETHAATCNHLEPSQPMLDN